MSFSPAYRAAIEDYHRMRRRAGLQKIFSIFRNRSLLSYEDVRRQLHAIEKSSVELKSIPINAIQGSVGRYTDFTRDFLPTKSVDPQRWARVKAQINSLSGVPPIEVYQLGEVYFVADGNHRVSVAQEMGSPTIDAYVRKVTAKVPFSLDEDLDQLLIKSEFVEFLGQTQFDRLYPDVDLTVTTPGRYDIILQQIEAFHFAREVEKRKSLARTEGVQHWYDNLYYPVVASIREQNILANYPNRTETDLFLWIFKHRASLIQSLGWEIAPHEVAKKFSKKPSSTSTDFFNQAKNGFRKFIGQTATDAGPPPGTWRQAKMAAPEGRLFANIIVVIDGSDLGWNTFACGTMIASQEGSQLYGLYLETSGKEIPSRKIKSIRSEFSQRCESCDTRGQLAFDSGPLDEIIKERADWADLVIVSTLGKSKSKIQTLIRTCPAPLLLTRGSVPEFKSAFFVYDGSPKSEEALFLAAYLATFWELSLSVITISGTEHNQIVPDPKLHAKEFLDYYGVDANYIKAKDKPINSILSALNEQKSDLIVVGGYPKASRIRTKNNLVDDVLKYSQQTIMICR